MTTKKFDEAASKKQAAELAENLVEHKAKRFVCSVCGYTVIAEEPPKECPQCREMMDISWPFEEVAPQKYVDELLANSCFTGMAVEQTETYVREVRQVLEKNKAFLEEKINANINV